MMTETEKQAFFLFKMKPIPLFLKVIIARGDFRGVK